MRRSCLKIVWMILIAGEILRAQVYVDSTLAGRRISEIRIAGNEKTQSFLFHREMKQKVGDRLSLERTEEDMRRILNLQLFNRVMIIGQPDGEDVLLTVLVTEQWYILPFPILYVNDRDWSKITYGAGLRHANFRGRAETLTLLVKLGYNPSAAFGYTNPWLTEKRTWTGKIETAYDRIRSKHFRDRKVDENRFAIRGSVGRRFGFHTSLDLELGYDRISLSPSVPGQTLSSDGVDQFPELGLLFVWDHRDLVEYPQSGWFVSGYFEKKGIPGNRIDWSRGTADLRGYLPVWKEITFAARTAATLSSGKVPVYDRVYLGYSERIRGHFSEKVEGENRILGSLALHFPLMPIQYWDMASESQLSDLRFGLGWGLFIDSGTIWDQVEILTHRNLIFGFGAGLHFFLPYNLILRLESAWNESGRQEWIVDLNVDI